MEKKFRPKTAHVAAVQKRAFLDSFYSNRNTTQLRGVTSIDLKQDRQAVSQYQTTEGETGLHVNSSEVNISPKHLNQRSSRGITLGGVSQNRVSHVSRLLGQQRGLHEADSFKNLNQQQPQRLKSAVPRPMPAKQKMNRLVSAGGNPQTNKTSMTLLTAY